MSGRASPVSSQWGLEDSVAPRPPSPTRPLSKPATALTSVERALKTSLSPPEIRDVHLYAFSRRVLYSDGAIRIDCPQPILAIGSILKETDHFSKLLTSGFSEMNSDAPHAIRQYTHESEYDYETDSDLDEFEEADSIPSPVAGSSSSSSSRSKGKGKDDGEMGEEDKAHVQSKGVGDTKAHQILIPSIAHRTLKACVFYLYTGKTNFLPLTSEGALQRALALLTTSESAAPACSPKSTFRLAESYGMTELQDLAYDGIVSRLKPENIVEEAFSSFFARYDRLREHAVSYLSQHYSTPAIQNLLPHIIERVVLGDMPHAGGVLRSLLGLRVAVSGPLPSFAAVAPSAHAIRSTPVPARAGPPSPAATHSDAGRNVPGGTPPSANISALSPSRQLEAVSTNPSEAGVSLGLFNAFKAFQGKEAVYKESTEPFVVIAEQTRVSKKSAMMRKNKKFKGRSDEESRTQGQGLDCRR